MNQQSSAPLNHDANPAYSSKAKARLWMFAPVALLSISVSGWLMMVSVAVDDPGFSVERDYYKKAANYDDVLAQRAKNEELGWTVHIVDSTLSDKGRAQLDLRIVDARGAALSTLAVDAEAFFVARGQDIKRAPLVEQGNGRYRLELDGARPGLWDVRLQARRGDDIYRDEIRVEYKQREIPPS